MESAGHSISTLFLCGGLGKNPLFVQMHADITDSYGCHSGESDFYVYLTIGSWLMNEKAVNRYLDSN
eukprot:bmy_09416T0